MYDFHFGKGLPQVICALAQVFGIIHVCLSLKLQKKKKSGKKYIPFIAYENPWTMLVIFHDCYLLISAMPILC